MPNGQRWLIIETSGRAAAVALADGGAVEARPLPEGRRHARDLAARTRELLDARGLRARDLDGVIVSQGPGSYTGLRVGVMSAKALAYATGCRLVAVETFRAIARQAPPGATAVDVLADAQQGRVYAQPFRRPAPLAPWEPAAPLRIRPLEEWAGELRPGAWVSGPGVTAYAGRMPAGAPLVPAADREPRVETLLEIGLEQAAAGQFADPWTLEPIYLRGSYAEEKEKGK